jgi:hypothetical protein
MESLTKASIFLVCATVFPPLVASTRQELATIQVSPIQVLPSAMGFNRNMPLVVIFGLASLGGIGLRHLHVEQGSLKISALIEHIQ